MVCWPSLSVRQPVLHGCCADAGHRPERLLCTAFPSLFARGAEGRQAERKHGKAEDLLFGDIEGVGAKERREYPLLVNCFMF